jgi:uncharacterized protein (DUF433 family)
MIISLRGIKKEMITLPRKGNMIFMERLENCSSLDFKKGFKWDGEIVTVNDIAGAIQNGISGDDTPYGDVWKHPVKAPKDKEYHVSRVVYFVQHPEEIKNIEIDNICDDYSILPLADIIDGWHRLMAAKYLGMDKIHVIYGGRADVLRYLQAKRKTLPTK